MLGTRAGERRPARVPWEGRRGRAGGTGSHPGGGRWGPGCPQPAARLRQCIWSRFALSDQGRSPLARRGGGALPGRDGAGFPSGRGKGQEGLGRGCGDPPPGAKGTDGGVGGERAPVPQHPMAGLVVLLLLEHILQRAGQVLEDGVQDALLLLFLLVPAARRDRLLGTRQAALTRLLQRGFLLCLLLLLLLQPVL